MSHHTNRFRPSLEALDERATPIAIVAPGGWYGDGVTDSVWLDLGAPVRTAGPDESAPADPYTFVRDIRASGL